MRREIGSLLAGFIGWGTLRRNEWWAVFGAGACLGAALLGMKLLLTEPAAGNPQGGADRYVYMAAPGRTGDERLVDTEFCRDTLKAGAAVRAGQAGGCAHKAGDEPSVPGGASGLGAGERREAGNGRSAEHNAGGTTGAGTVEGSGAAGERASRPAVEGLAGAAGEGAAGSAGEGTIGAAGEGTAGEGSAAEGTAGNGSSGEASAGRTEKPTAGQTEKPAAERPDQELDKLQIRVYLTGERRVEQVPLETYIVGVLAGEMPADFEPEALKAQAIAARTYILRRLAGNDTEDTARYRADVTDTVQHQVYVSKARLDAEWASKAKQADLKKLKRAAEETKGLIVTYGGEPIEAVFFSTSNGYTENSEEYWEQEMPYLRSVASPWDKTLSPRFEQQLSLDLSSFYRLIGLSGSKAKGKPSIKIKERTEGNRVKRLTVNGAEFTGREMREKLGLASTEFKWKIGDDEIVFTTYGSGHGIGMSQWGANGMAKEGASAEDIISHYYTGAEVEQASKLPELLSKMNIPHV